MLKNSSAADILSYISNPHRMWLDNLDVENIYRTLRPIRSNFGWLIDLAIPQLCISLEKADLASFE